MVNSKQAMRTGNPLDGMYFLLLAVPFLLSLWLGDFVRKKIISRLVLQSPYGHYLSSCAGAVAEIVIITAGILTGLILIKMI